MGYRLDLMEFASAHAGQCTRGYSISRFMNGNTKYSVILGMAHSPVSSNVYLRMLGVQADVPGYKGKPPGFLLEGDILASSSDLFRSIHLSKRLGAVGSEAHHKCYRVIAGLFTYLQQSSILEGGTIKPKEALGLMTSDWIGCMLGAMCDEPQKALEAFGPNSMEWVIELNYNVALGIVDDVETVIDISGKGLPALPGKKVVPTTFTSMPAVAFFKALKSLVKLRTAVPGYADIEGDIGRELLARSAALHSQFPATDLWGKFLFGEDVQLGPLDWGGPDKRTVHCAVTILEKSPVGFLSPGMRQAASSYSVHVEGVLKPDLGFHSSHWFHDYNILYKEEWRLARKSRVGIPVNGSILPQV